VGYCQEVRRDKFFGAVEHGSWHYVQGCLEAGLDLQLRNEYGQTGLYVAAWHGHLRVVCLLLHYHGIVVVAAGIEAAVGTDPNTATATAVLAREKREEGGRTTTTTTMTTTTSTKIICRIMMPTNDGTTPLYAAQHSEHYGGGGGGSGGQEIVHLLQSVVGPEMATHNDENDFGIKILTPPRFWVALEQFGRLSRR
jgi:hypothetical protein